MTVGIKLLELTKPVHNTDNPGQLQSQSRTLSASKILVVYHHTTAHSGLLQHSCACNSSYTNLRGIFSGAAADLPGSAVDACGCAPVCCRSRNVALNELVHRVVDAPLRHDPRGAHSRALHQAGSAIGFD